MEISEEIHNALGSFSVGQDIQEAILDILLEEVIGYEE